MSTKQRIYDLNIDSSINFIVNVVSPRKAASIYVPVCVGFQVKIHIDIRLSECCQKKKKKPMMDTPVLEENHVLLLAIGLGGIGKLDF